MVEVPALNARIHPHYGVFAPVRGEYVGLVNKAALPEVIGRESVAFDIGTGTGVLAAVLAQRGIKRIVATDQDARALACARENLARLGEQVGIDLWHYKEDNRTLKQALDYLVPYWLEPQRWPGEQIKVFNSRLALPLLNSAGQIWGDPIYQRAAEQLGSSWRDDFECG